MAPRARFLDTCGAILVLCLAGASTAFGFAVATARHLEVFVAHNTASEAGRRRLLAVLGVGAGVALLASSLYWLRRRDRGAEHLRRASRIASPLVLAGLLFPILRSDDALDLLARASAMAVFVVALEPLLRVSLREVEALSGAWVVRAREAARRALAWLVRGSAYAVGLSAVGYALYASHALHAAPALVLRWCALASGAVAIDRMGRRRVSRGAGLVLALAYLLYAPVHGTSFDDAHVQPFGAAAVLWAVDALDARHTKRFLLFFVLALSCQGDIPLLFVGVALYLLIADVRPAVGILLGAASAAWFVLAGGGSALAVELKTAVLDPLHAWQTVTKPEKLVYLLQLLTPLAFLPLRGKAVWTSLVPGALLTMLAPGDLPAREAGFPYTLDFVALIFPAAILALEPLRDRAPAARPAALLAVATGTLVTTTAWGVIPPR